MFMTYRDAVVPAPRKCDFYSPRVRLFWSQASRAPDARGALSDFNSIMRHRDAVFRKLRAAREEAERTLENHGEIFEPTTPDPAEISRWALSSPNLDPTLRERLMQLETLWNEVE
jgi:hypothetical protein